MRITLLAFIVSLVACDWFVVEYTHDHEPRALGMAIFLGALAVINAALLVKRAD